LSDFRRFPAFAEVPNREKILGLVKPENAKTSVMTMQMKSLKSSWTLALALLATCAAGSAIKAAGNNDDREIRTKDRQNYEVLVGDFYTGRSPYFNKKADAPLMVAPAAPAPSGKCSVINTGLIQATETMPAEATLGELFTYQINVTATGCAANVVVADMIPEGSTLVSTEPEASVNGNQVVWNLGNLDAGESKVLKVTVKADREGTLVSCASIKADPRICAQTVVGKAKLAIDKSGPEVAQLGSDVTYNIVVKNVGTAVAKNVVVTDKVPAGLGGEKEIPFTVGDLAPGASKTIPVTLKAADRGKFCNLAVASAANAESVQDDACTTIVKPGLKLEKTGRDVSLINKKVTYKITASNTGDTDLTGVVVTDNAPAETKVVSAPGAQVNGNAASWTIDTLKSGESKTFEVTVTTAKPGKWCNQAAVTTKEGLKDTAEACTLWKGVAAILLEVVDDPDPIQVGEQTTYTVRITNQGNSDLVNVNSTAFFAAEIDPVSASEGSVDGKKVKFPTIDRLAPKASHTYTISAKGVAEGDHRLKVVLTEDSLLAPVNEEESTRVY
jgi:uncharacterized repeat protein (TIGR01451 family)